MAKSLFRIGGYFVATSSQAAISFVAVPLLIHALGVAEFGRWGIVEPIIQIAAQIGLLGINQGIIKLVNQDGYNPSRAFFTLLKPALPILLCVCLATSLISASVGFSLGHAAFLGLLVGAESLLMLALAGMRAGNIVTGFVAASLLKALGVLAVLLCNRQFGFPLITTAEQVVVWWSGISVAGLSVAVISLSLLARGGEQTQPTESAYWTLYRDSVRYGLPMLISSLLMLAVLNLDRFFLQHYLDYRQVGEYVVYVKIANAMNFLVMPVQLWWPTARFNAMKSKDGGQLFFKRSAMALVTIFCVAGIGLWVIAPYLHSYFAPSVSYKKFLMLILIGAIVIYALSTPLNVGLLMPGKTHYNMYVIGVAALVNILTCYFLIPIFGVMGAAAGVLCAQLLTLVGQHFLSQRYYWVGHNYSFMLPPIAIYIAVVIYAQSLFEKSSVFLWMFIYSSVSALLVLFTYLLWRRLNKEGLVCN